MRKLVLLFALILPLAIYAVPAVKAVTVFQGNSGSRIPNSNAKLNFTIENPDEADVRVSLQVKSEHSKSLCVYATDITVPAKTSIQTSTNIMVEETNELLVECIHQGKVIYKDKVLTSLKTSSAMNVAILNDNQDISGFSKAQKNPDLPHQAIFLTYKYSNAPELWNGYDGFAAVIIVAPAFENYTTQQINALLDYISMGGVLYIASPDAPQNMLENGLGELLPFTPAGTFTENNYASLAKALNIPNWKDSPDFDENGVPSTKTRPVFVNALPKTNAHPILAIDNRGYIYSMPYGMGNVFAFTFQPFNACNTDPRFFKSIWRLMQYNTNFEPVLSKIYDTGLANETLQMLHGYTIPPISTVVRILALYIIVSILILAVMFKLKRHSSGWIIVCVFGLGITAYIMLKSSDISNTHNTLSTANICVTTWDGAFGASKNNTLMLALKDISPTVITNAEKVFLRQQPPKPIYEKSSTQAMPASPLWIKNNRSNTFLEKLSLQKARPRPLLWLTAGNHNTKSLSSMPHATFTQNGLHLQDWTLPKELTQAYRAALAVNSSIRTIDISNGTVHDSGSKQRLEADTVLLSAMEFIKAQYKHSPQLILITKNRNGKKYLVNPQISDDNTTYYDYEITAVPVTLDFEDKPNFVPEEFFTIQIPNNSPLRSAYAFGQWVEMPNTNLEKTSYTLNLHAPADLVMTSPQTIQLTLDISLPSQSFSANPWLLATDGTKVTPAEHKGNVYIFKPEGKEVISPITSNMHLCFEIKNGIGATASVSRDSFSLIHKLAVSVVNK